MMNVIDPDDDTLFCLYDRELRLRGDDWVGWTGSRDGVLPFRVCWDRSKEKAGFTGVVARKGPSIEKEVGDRGA